MSTWFLLSDSRIRALRAWNISFGLVLLLVLIQTATGKFSGIEATAWLWVAAVLLPGFILLNASAWLNKSPSKIVHPGAHRAMIAATIVYLGLVLCVLLFSQAAIAQNDYGLDTWLMRSLWILLPFQSLILVSFWLVFFRRENILKPSAAAMLDLVNKKVGQAQRQKNTTRLQCLELVASNDLPGAFEQLTAYFEKKDQANLHTVIALNGQYSTLLRETQLNTIDPAQSQRNLNRIAIALIELAEKIST